MYQEKRCNLDYLIGVLHEVLAHGQCMAYSRWSTKSSVAQTPQAKSVILPCRTMELQVYGRFDLLVCLVYCAVLVNHI